jgi:hypothetical protein
MAKEVPIPRRLGADGLGTFFTEPAAHEPHRDLDVFITKAARSCACTATT